MKAISLHQPYASLIACGLKKIETRGKRTSYRGPLLIHAAKKWTVEQLHTLNVLIGDHEAVAASPLAEPRDPPLGVVVAVARLVDVRIMVGPVGARVRPEGTIRVDEQTPLERAVGDWSLGRYAWILEDVRAIQAPGIPLRGMQATPFNVALEDVDPIHRECLLYAWQSVTGTPT